MERRACAPETVNQTVQALLQSTHNHTIRQAIIMPPTLAVPPEQSGLDVGVLDSRCLKRHLQAAWGRETRKPAAAFRYRSSVRVCMKAVWCASAF